MEKYDVVGANYDPAHGSYIIMADRSPLMSNDLAMRELGYASPSPFTSWVREERVPELMGKIGLRTYFDMKRADGTVRGSLRLLKTPIMAARWFVEPDWVAPGNLARTAGPPTSTWTRFNGFAGVPATSPARFAKNFLDRN